MPDLVEQNPGPKRLALWLFLAWLAFFMLLTRGHFQSTDEIAVFQQARSLWERGTLDVAPMLNTRVGPNGLSYAAYGIGQSIAAAPLYGLGSGLHAVLKDTNDWAKVLSGPVVGRAPILWGGEVEIFFVSLFGALVTALLCLQFFYFSTAIGASVRAGLLSTTLLGTSSYIAGFASTFYQHSLEALVLFSCFYLLFTDASTPSGFRRASAGVLAGYGILVRAHTLVLLPALSGYLLWNSWRRHRSTAASRLCTLQGIAIESTPFAGFVVLGVVAQILVTYAKFGTASYSGAYGGQRFDEPLLLTLYGFLFSPGKSVFLFTPLLIMMPVYWKPFFSQHRAAAICALVGVGSYLVFFAKYEGWHGTWGLGPRYLAATVPFLLLPFASWWDTRASAWRVAAIALGAVGAFVELLHVSVNFSYVWYAEKYDTFRPALGYLFIPQASPLVGFYRGLVAGDLRVDMWLVNVYRAFGLGRLLIVSTPLLAALAYCVWRVLRAVQETPPQIMPSEQGVRASQEQQPPVSTVDLV